MIMIKRNVAEIILATLEQMKEIQYDFDWVVEFDSWENSDHSEVGLTSVYILFLIENQQGGLFGEREASVDTVCQLDKKVYNLFVD
jgi:hypothetical protein